MYIFIRTVQVCSMCQHETLMMHGSFVCVFMLCNTVDSLVFTGLFLLLNFRELHYILAKLKGKEKSCILSSQLARIQK